MLQLTVNEEQLKAFKFCVDFIAEHNFMTLYQSNELCEILRNPIDIGANLSSIPISTTITPNSETKPDKFLGTWKVDEEGTVVVIYDIVKRVIATTHKNVYDYIGIVMPRIPGPSETALGMLQVGLWDSQGNFLNRNFNKWDIRERIQEKSL